MYSMKVYPLDRRSLESLHKATLAVLNNPGMKILAAELVDGLKKKGAKVDESKNIVRFPQRLIENTLEQIQKEIRGGIRQNILNGDLSSKTDGTIQAKFGGACHEYIDYDKQEVRKPTREDLVNLLQLGEAIPEVALVGNPVMLLEESGKPVDPRLQPVKTAAIVAKNTSKPASTEIWRPEELDFLVDIGVVVRGSLEKYKKNPCFITAKETVSPLILGKEAGEVLLALAKRGLPCTIMPMAIAGAGTPVTKAGNVVIANAEILGTLVAIRALAPDALVAGSVSTGIMDMATGNACFATAEAIIQDLMLAQLHEELYGFDFGIGTGITDAKYPGIQAAIEKEMKFIASALTNRTNYPVGTLMGAKRFSPEQSMIDLEIVRYIHETFYKEISVDENDLAIQVIEKVGPGGNFIGEDHTLQNFRKALWHPDLIDRTTSAGWIRDKERDMLAKANQKWKEILKKSEPYHLDSDQEKEIDKIVKKAERILTR